MTGWKEQKDQKRGESIDYFLIVRLSNSTEPNPSTRGGWTCLLISPLYTNVLKPGDEMETEPWCQTFSMFFCGTDSIVSFNKIIKLICATTLKHQLVSHPAWSQFKHLSVVTGSWWGVAALSLNLCWLHSARILSLSLSLSLSLFLLGPRENRSVPHRSILGTTKKVGSHQNSNISHCATSSAWTSHLTSSFIPLHSSPKYQQGRAQSI